jgi:uncharacterized membrane protein
MSQTQTSTSTRRLARTVSWEVILAILLAIVTLGGSLLIASILLPNLIASTRERWRLRQRLKEIAKFGAASVAK